MPVIGKTAMGLSLYIPPEDEYGKTPVEHVYWLLRCGLYINPPKDD